MKTFTFYLWVTENGSRIYKEFTFQVPKWSVSRKMMSDAMKAYA